MYVCFYLSSLKQHTFCVNIDFGCVGPHHLKEYMLINISTKLVVYIKSRFLVFNG